MRASCASWATFFPHMKNRLQRLLSSHFYHPPRLSVRSLLVCAACRSLSTGRYRFPFHFSPCKASALFFYALVRCQLLLVPAAQVRRGKIKNANNETVSLSRIFREAYTISNHILTEGSNEAVLNNQIVIFLFTFQKLQITGKNTL